MAKLAKTPVFASVNPRNETLLDKTTRIARRINDDEVEVRYAKTARLRKARVEIEADTHGEVAPGTSSKTRKRR